MNIPESWLRIFCNPKLSGQQLADKLTMAGIEVEAYTPVGAQIAGDLVVAEVLSVEKHPNAVPISALTGKGVPELLSELGTQLRPIREFLELSVPHEKQEVIARLHEVGQVIERNYEGDTARFKARIPPHLHGEFAAFVVRELQTA